MMEFKFSADAWQQYLAWQEQDRKTLRRINELLRDISRGGYEGIGKPEPLKGDLHGLWSRRINDKHRMVYSVSDGMIYVYVLSLRFHYTK